MTMLPRSFRALFAVVFLVSLCSPVALTRAEADAKQEKTKPKANEVKPQAVKPKATPPTATPAPKRVPVRQVGWMTLRGGLPEGPPPFAMPGMTSQGRTLRSVIQQLHHVADSQDHVGLVIHLDQAALPWSQIHELSEAIKSIRAKNKRVLFFSETYGLTAYLLACSGDEILLQEKGVLALNGLGVEEMYLAGTFEKIGLKPDFVQIGQYKGADEMFMRKGPSEAWSQNFDNLLDSLWDQAVDRIAKARKLDRDGVEKAMKKTWYMGDRHVVKSKLIDRVVSRDLLDVTTSAFGKKFAWDKRMGMQAGGPAMDNPLAILQALMAPPTSGIKRDTIALIHMKGPITSGESSIGGLFGGGTTVGSATMQRTLRKAAYNDKIKGIVIRIDSPGGSAIASEVIWQAVREAAKKKPVYVSMGSLAASGGYYIACSGDRIYASPNSMLGSIGVVSGKIAMGGLYEWAGIKIHRRTRGPNADIFNSVEPFTPKQRKQIVKMGEQFYKTFTSRVKQGRGKKIDIDKVAEGRLFTGLQAKDNGLVDKLGGVEKTLADMASKAKLKPGEYDVVMMPEPMGMAEYFEQMFSISKDLPTLNAEQAGVIAIMKEALGPNAWPTVQTTLNGLSLLRNEPVLMLMPQAIVVR